MTTKIEYHIISRGELEIIYKNKKVLITGELTFSTAVFYADLKSIENNFSKYEIINFISEDKEKW
jgi:hypothetical protein